MTLTAYIAGIGMITAVGENAEMTAASVRAGISRYGASRFRNGAGEPITMACVPDELFAADDFDIDEGRYYGERDDRMIKMAILAAGEAIAGRAFGQPVPLLLGFPEPLAYEHPVMPALLRDNLVRNIGNRLTAENSRSIHTGRPAGIELIDWALRYLYELNHDFVLVGAADSPQSYPALSAFDEAERLATPGQKDGFAPGEGAGFLLLTRHRERAMTANGQRVALSAPGIAEEPGHLYSSEPYRGDGLDRAFKEALRAFGGDAPIDAVYSSMNGESHWAKEYGVALLRNQAAFAPDVRIEHPADCYGDLGAATAPVLIGLAAMDLLARPQAGQYLVYASADRATRAAVVIARI